MGHKRFDVGDLAGRQWLALELLHLSAPRSVGRGPGR